MCAREAEEECERIKKNHGQICLFVYNAKEATVIFIHKALPAEMSTEH